MVLDKEEILQALKEIYDPEIPSGYRHLGLNYDIRMEDLYMSRQRRLLLPVPSAI